jgi:hypothetical protein
MERLAGGVDRHDAPLPGGLGGLGPWEVLPTPIVGGQARHPLRVDFALLHPTRGIALVDIAPRANPSAVRTLRQTLAALDPPLAARLAGIPVVHCCLAPDEIRDLPRLLDRAFAGEVPMRRGVGDWVAVARGVLRGNGRQAVPPPLRDGGAARRGPRRWLTVATTCFAVASLAAAGAGMIVSGAAQHRARPLAEVLPMAAALPPSAAAGRCAPTTDGGCGTAQDPSSARAPTALDDRSATADAGAPAPLPPTEGDLARPETPPPMDLAMRPAEADAVPDADMPDTAPAGAGTPALALVPDQPQADSLGQDGGDPAGPAVVQQEPARAADAKEPGVAEVAARPAAPASAVRPATMRLATVTSVSAGAAPAWEPVSPRCAPLLARLQLGEIPTNDDRRLLRTACAPRP